MSHRIKAGARPESSASQSADALCKQGSLRWKQGKIADALACYREAARCDPHHVRALRDLGRICQETGAREEAAECYRRLLQIHPDRWEERIVLGNILKDLGKLSEAADHYEQVLTLKPENVEASLALGHIMMMQGSIDAAESLYRRVLEINPKNMQVRSCLLGALHYRCNDPEQVFREHREWEKHHASGRADRPVYRNTREPDRRLRVAYVSPDFRTHSVAFFIEPLLANHNPAAVESICYANVAQPDNITAHLRSLASAWRDIYRMSDDEVARQIQRDRVDILVDLASHTADNRLLVFARKPAPLQVSYIGYPDTSGLAAMDYRFTDAWADPPGVSDRLHSETLIRLPNGFLCYRPAGGTEVRPPPFRSTGHITFGSFNSVSKVSPDTLALWSKLLHRVPDSRLLLKSNLSSNENAWERLYEWFEQTGIERSRLELTDGVKSMAEHLACYGRVDIALDTYPYNGTTTTCEALWMGVPVVTLAGQTHASRVGVSLLSQMGLEAFIATSPADYVDIASRLATDRDQLLRMRTELRHRMAASSLCNGKEQARQIEQAYRTLWHKWCAADGK